MNFQTDHLSLKTLYHTFANNQGEALYIIRSLSAVYHQCEALHLIKPQGKCTLTRDEIQGRLADLDDMHRTSCGDDMPSLRLG